MREIFDRIAISSHDRRDLLLSRTNSIRDTRRYYRNDVFIHCEI